MIQRRATTHLFSRLGVLLLVGAALSGCSPDPSTTPTPTPVFASEEEAFAAAEKVYRDYVEAADSPEGRADAYLVGTALEEYLDGVSYLKSNQLTLAGHTSVLSFEGASLVNQDAVARIDAQACIDLSASTIVDASGTVVTPAERGRFWRIRLRFIGDESGLLINSYEGEEDPECAHA